MRIKQFGEAILREKSLPIEKAFLSSDAFKQLLQYMKDTLNGIQGISAENGNALSAPQCGQAIRLILLRIDQVFVPMINPEIIRYSEETFDFEEECFSAYDLRAMVKRFSSIDVRYLDENGAEHQMYAEGELSGLIQHEIDHLNGKLFVDHLPNQEMINSIDDVFSDDPQRLKQLKEMMAYMAG